MRWNIDDVPVFVAVVEHGGITAAAESLAMPKSTVSVAVSRLERGLGLRLLDRNSRNLRITAEGTAFHRHALLILEQVREADATVAGLRADPAGRLSVALPPAFCQEIVAPRLAAFRARYPGIDLDLVVTSRGAELLRDQIDLAVVVGPLEASDLMARTLLAGPLIWVTSPRYRDDHALGRGLDDIRSHVQICEKRYGIARMPVHIDGAAGHIDLARGISHVTNPLVVRQAVMNGAGISVLPRHYCREQIASGQLAEICRHVSFDIAASTLTAVHLSRRLTSPRLRAFLDFLVEACR